MAGLQLGGVLFLALIAFTACSPPPERDLGGEQVKVPVLHESYLYFQDSGQLFGVAIEAPEELAIPITAVGLSAPFTGKTFVSNFLRPAPVYSLMADTLGSGLINTRVYARIFDFENRWWILTNGEKAPILRKLTLANTSGLCSDTPRVFHYYLNPDFSSLNWTVDLDQAGSPSPCNPWGADGSEISSTFLNETETGELRGALYPVADVHDSQGVILGFIAIRGPRLVVLNALNTAFGPKQTEIFGTDVDMAWKIAESNGSVLLLLEIAGTHSIHRYTLGDETISDAIESTPAGDFSQFHSDGSSAYYVMSNKIYRLPITGTSTGATLLTTASGAISGDSLQLGANRLLYQQNDGSLWTVGKSASAETAVQLTTDGSIAIVTTPPVYLAGEWVYYNSGPDAGRVKTDDSEHLITFPDAQWVGADYKDATVVDADFQLDKIFLYYKSTELGKENTRILYSFNGEAATLDLHLGSVEAQAVANFGTPAFGLYQLGIIGNSVYFINKEKGLSLRKVHESVNTLKILD
ncbi:MAG: hypothetical protein OEZ47_08755 [Gammaproteobacteria bacterium]|nr:hypothetical protein [Gammaproteobacteria bacterium]